MISKESGISLSEVTERDFGRCAHITISESTTTIAGGKGDASLVHARIAQLESQLERARIEHDQDSLRLRIARLSGRIAMIRVGGTTSVELKERMHRVEDSLSAAQAALEGGVLPGGGKALAQAASVVDLVELTGDAIDGREVVRRSLGEPLRWIANNAGYEGDQVLERVVELPAGQGFDALSGEYRELVGIGVMDPFQVTSAALESAASIAALIITTETAIVEQVAVNPGAIIAPGFGDLAEGMIRPSNIY